MGQLAPQDRPAERARRLRLTEVVGEEWQSGTSGALEICGEVLLELPYADIHVATLPLPCGHFKATSGPLQAPRFWARLAKRTLAAPEHGATLARRLADMASFRVTPNLLSPLSHKAFRNFIWSKSPTRFGEDPLF